MKLRKGIPTRRLQDAVKCRVSVCGMRGRFVLLKCMDVFARMVSSHDAWLTEA